MALSKSKQNITRDSEIENNLTVTRGERRGHTGQGGRFSGTTIKDTWTKPRGVGVEAREGGGFKRRQL